MSRVSSKLKGYNGANPFHEAQAKTFGDAKVIEEFFPVSAYWSLFNEQHEILIGTRGSGKTAILRMLSYSCLRKHEKAKTLLEDKKFIGFYIPLHLEFMSSFPGVGTPDEKKKQYFVFSFNCTAIKALLYEIPSLLEDCFNDPKERMLAEAKILEHCSELWFPNEFTNISTIDDLKWQIDLLYNHTDFWIDGTKQEIHPFSKSIFWPVIPALARIVQDLKLDPKKINWFACIDEAEFLSEPFLRCINEFLRSEKKPLVIKLATLPFRHSTKDTLTPGVTVEANGNDFNYRIIDLKWDSNDFKNLTDHLCKVRLLKSGIDVQNLELETFLGIEGNDNWLDYYRLEVPEAESTEEFILAEILKALSLERKTRFNLIKSNKERVQSDYYKRFSPIYYVRRMKLESARGNRTVGWFAGASVVRRIADGNPRRFIQLMNEIFETARNYELTPKYQHRINYCFCQRQYDACEGLPEHGLLLKRILDLIGKLLEERTHGQEMIDGGYDFGIQEDLLEIPILRKALELGIAYSVIHTTEETLASKITSNSELRLAHFVAVKFWLPMRKGERAILKSKHSKILLVPEKAPKTIKESNQVMDILQLSLIPGYND